MHEIFESDRPFNKIIPQPDWSKVKNEDGELPIKKQLKIHQGELLATTMNFLARVNKMIDICMEFKKLGD